MTQGGSGPVRVPRSGIRGARPKAARRIGIASAVDAAARGRSLPLAGRAAIVAGLLGACWIAHALAGPSMIVLVHVYYLVVLLAALWFDVPTTTGVALAAGLMGGPLAPPGFVPDTHASTAWIVRLAFYVAVGVFAAAGVQELLRRSDRLRSTYANLTRLYSATLRGFVLALEMKDEETWAHCERVATNAREMGRALGLPADECELLYWAGYLHDVGKLATPSQILAKPGALTPEEFEIVKRHAERGEKLLLSVSPTFADIARGVRHHHERWDGGGYPDGLAGDEIPLFGRILAVVDVFEALTSTRPYRAAWSEEDAAQVVEGEAGTHFDPRLARLFLTLHEGDRLHVQGRHGPHPVHAEPVVFDPALLRTSA